MYTASAEEKKKKALKLKAGKTQTNEKFNFILAPFEKCNAEMHLYLWKPFDLLYSNFFNLYVSVPR